MFNRYWDLGGLYAIALRSVDGVARTGTFWMGPAQRQWQGRLACS